MARKKYIAIQKEGVEGKCLPNALDVWKRNGWTVVDDGDSEEVPLHAASSDEDQVYDLPGLVVIPDDLQDEE